jgi:hypothetical protein
MDDERLATRSWKVGTTVITSVVEDQIDHIPPEFFFADATAENGWCRTTPIGKGTSRCGSRPS